MICALERISGLHLIKIDITSHPQAKDIPGLIQILKIEKCRFLITINEWGMDCEGVLCEYLKQSLTLHINWFVDDPFFEELIQKRKFRPSPMRIDFVSDKGYLPIMATKKYNPFFLPLATDPSIFHPSGESVKEFDIVFVGNSYRDQINKYLEHVKVFFDGLIPLLNGVVKAYQQDVSYDVEMDLREKLQGIKLPSGLYPEKALFIAKQVAGYLQRKNLITSLAKRYPQFTIFGDDGWLVDIPAERVRKAAYYKNLADIYRRSKIVLDVNRVVIRNGFTQRTFDSLACSSFVITSAKPVVYEYFNTTGPLQEIAVFRNQNELNRLIDYYIEHNEEMSAIAYRGSRKVYAEHTYDNRVRQMLTIASEFLKKTQM